MGRTTTKRALTAAAVSLLVAAAAAPAAPARELTTTLTGALTISWTAEPSLRCAAAGLCGVSGSIVVLPEGSSSTSGGPAPIELTDFTSTARVVQRATDGTIVSTCSDLVPVDVSLTVRHTGQGLRAAVEGQPAQGPSSGRCAGPTASDLQSVTLPARRFGARSYDLTGSTTFTSGPFAVTAASSVRALITTGSSAPGVLGGTGAGISGSFFGGGPGTPPKLRSALQEHVAVQYRVTSTRGGFEQTFTGLAPPLCAGVGACGSSGTLAETLAGLRSISFYADRVVRHSVGPRAALADVRSGRLRLDGVPLTTPASDSVTERMTGADGATCSQQVSVGQFFPMPVIHRHGADGVRLTSNGTGEADPLRTRCPGPAAADVFGGQVVLGTAVLPTHAIGDPRLTLRFTHAGAFTGGGYAGSRTGSVVLTLQRVSEHAGTRHIKIVPGVPGGGVP